jgi:hypothetical protein
MKPNICKGYTPPIHLTNFEMGRSGVGKPEGRSLSGKAIAIGGEERGDRGCIFEEKSDRQEKGAIALGGKRGAIALGGKRGAIVGVLFGKRAIVKRRGRSQLGEREERSQAKEQEVLLLV